LPVRSDDPLRRITLNLYEADCKWLEQHYGYGWTERVRQHIHNEVMKRLYTNKYGATTQLTLGDLADD
jgi:hypothetical protein